MTLLAISFISMLLLGFPFMVVLLGSILLFMVVHMPGFDMTLVVQQVITGMIPPALVCVPMFILAASIMTSGQAANKLINLVKAFVGHLPGGLPIAATGACTVFGAVSGSTQATVAAIGGTMRPMLLKAGYPSKFTLGLIINASDIAFLIPPSIGFIVYGVVTGTSIGSLFLAGVLPGIMIFLMFSLYCIVYSKIKGLGSLPKASWQERGTAIKEGALVLGFPIIVVGGIYGGIFTPTEAAAVSVAHALFLEGVFYKTLSWSSLKENFFSTGIVTGAVFILVGGGQALSWILCFLRIPQQFLPSLFGTDPSQIQVFAVIVGAYFVACMFVDPIVAVYVLTPILAPYVISTGINPVHLGIIVTLQCAVGSASPPFGCDIFTAQLIFRRPYLEVIGHTYPFLIILMLATVLLIAFPQISLFLPGLAH